MSSTVGRYDFPARVAGTTIPEQGFTVIVNNLPFDLSNTTITVKARGQKNCNKAYTLTTTITDAVNAEFKIDEQLLNWPPDTYFYSVEFDTLGIVKVYIEGYITLTRNSNNG